MKENPYASPQSSEYGSLPASQNTFFAWERLRLKYNLVIVVCIAFATGPGLPGLLRHNRFWESSLWVALAANGAFSIGHLMLWFFTPKLGRPKSVQNVLLGILSFVALAIAIGAVAAEMYPGI